MRKVQISPGVTTSSAARHGPNRRDREKNVKGDFPLQNPDPFARFGTYKIKGSDMKTSWAEITGKFGAGAAAIDPYENWEKANVPPNERAAGKERWQPVYIELATDAPVSAAALLDALKTDEFRLGAYEVAALKAVAKATSGKKVPHRFLRIFLFRPEGLAYVPVESLAGKLLYTVLHVGPAIPYAFVLPFIAADQIVVDASERALAQTVVTAVVDDFIGFANARFRDSEFTSRFHYFWAQGLPSEGAAGSPVILGQELDKVRIGKLLTEHKNDERALYQAVYAKGLRQLPPAPAKGAALKPSDAYDFRRPDFRRLFDFNASHGTFVADLAGGYPTNTGADRPMVGVQLPKLATLETWGARLDCFILMAVQQILSWADHWPATATKKKLAPVVINISYGVHAGAKDGSGFLEAEIARLVDLRNHKQKVPTAVVLPAGNGYRDNAHARIELLPKGSGEVTWRVQPGDLSVSFLELWLDRKTSVALTVVPPQGAPLSIDLNGAAAIHDWQRIVAGGSPVTIGRIWVQEIGERLRVVLGLCPTENHSDPMKAAPCGGYLIRLENNDLRPVGAIIDCQRDDTPSSFPDFGRQSYLDHKAVDAIDPATQNRIRPEAPPVDWNGTLSAYATATGTGVYVVGGAMGADAWTRAALYSGAGPTASRPGPDLAAVSEESRAHPGILASGTYSNSAAVFSGTSAAAPQVTRAIVEWLAKNPGAGLPGVADLLTQGTVFAVGDAQLGAGIISDTWRAGRKERRRAT